MGKRIDLNKSVELFLLNGKSALITGATGYLGSAMAYAVAEAGAHVLINSRSKERCLSIVNQLKTDGLSAQSAVFDVTDERAIRQFFQSIENLPLNILINNAYAGGQGNIEECSSEDYKISYDVTIIATHNIFSAALPNLRKAVRKTGDASVINISSMYGLVSPNQNIYSTGKSANPPYYSAAKAALIQWSRYAACEFGNEGIRVNSISPGPFPSKDFQSKNPILIEKIKEKVPLGRIGISNEIKGPVLFLASSASSFVNGSNIVVDGGWTAW